ncbi:hypothetical protein DYU05_04040 [Mucilaginibacter terrenus]|uniref:Uncharacterized protein n=1 Tax=Mucilaginibacter terrenus TaxID=2482727 RepID=A0A3E2NUT4_9SPHI|nr:helix-turn-helix domain-containing protein [Mucilaginibacter terrenus]RFZ84786.1 hypothetical protein DYU05_04040 [Mucilaginibacter terrenus]
MCPTPKYSIRKFLYAMNGKITKNRYLICIELDITETTLDNWMNTPLGAKFSIPSDPFLKLCNIFNCQPSELING